MEARMKLSILIPTTPGRKPFLDKLKDQFISQLGEITQSKNQNGLYTISWPNVEVIMFTDNKENSVGYKRNVLLKESVGKYIAFIDDDDVISDDYFKVILAGIDTDPDAIELKGIITEDGNNPKLFIHSMKYDSWFEKDNVYYRNNNHLSPVRSSIAKQMKFPEINTGEDHSYSKQLHESGLIKTEYPVDKPYYFYKYVSNK